ncbi:MAG: hypothetical protein CVU64_19315 [Deltaproteobacteria bacterium HGW-Deltaproteobacteria-21]|nr:MAG: hypothetical protein CVU64_19315 [Deltaproteobacteria bacterium HGW-Deltaproteobacteria-21]
MFCEFLAKPHLSAGLFTGSPGQYEHPCTNLLGIFHLTDFVPVWTRSLTSLASCGEKRHRPEGVGLQAKRGECARCFGSGDAFWLCRFSDRPPCSLLETRIAISAIGERGREQWILAPRLRGGRLFAGMTKWKSGMTGSKSHMWIRQTRAQRGERWAGRVHLSAGRGSFRPLEP